MDVFIYMLYAVDVFIYMLYAVDVFIYMLYAVDVFIYMLYAWTQNEVCKWVVFSSCETELTSCFPCFNL